MPPSRAETQGYERISKYPKSTKYGRQNPISARWNSEDQLVLWRAAWADVTNHFLEQAGVQERVDHRSHAERGLDEQPTIHEGVAARALEQKGIISDRCELNRQIKADNALLRELKALVKKLMDAVKNTVPAIAEAMETARQKMIVFRYHLLHIGARKKIFPARSKLSSLISGDMRISSISSKARFGSAGYCWRKRKLSRQFKYSSIGNWRRKSLV